MASMVRFLHFADTFLINGQSHTPTVWAGTNGGTILVCQITMPANDKRDSEVVSCQLGTKLCHYYRYMELSAHTVYCRIVVHALKG